MTEVSTVPAGPSGSSNGPLSYQENSDIKSPMTGRSDETEGDSRARIKSTVENNVTTNGDIGSDLKEKKASCRLPGPIKKNLSSPAESPLKSPGTPKAKALPKTPETPSPSTTVTKKLPMNKIQVGAAPSPNLRAARSKVGSLANTTHKPGGGNIKIENHKIDFSGTQSRIEAKNDQYVRSGGDKKIPQVKLQWEAKSKVGSLENATYKPGGGDKKIESIKLDFKEKAKSKVGSKDNVKHVPGGGTVKIESQKLEFKAQSKVGSLDNVKHKPGGGDVKIFDDKTYLKQISGNNSEGRISGTQSYGDLIKLRKIEGRSIPGTPGHKKTSINFKKATLFGDSGTKYLNKNINEGMISSKMLINNVKKGHSEGRQQLKLNSKLPSSEERVVDNGPGEIIKLPAYNNTQLLGSKLINNSIKNITDKQVSRNTVVAPHIKIHDESIDLSKEKKNYINWKQTSESSKIPESKLFNINNTSMLTLLNNEKAAETKFGGNHAEMRELNENPINILDYEKKKESDISSSSINDSDNYGKGFAFTNASEQENYNNINLQEGSVSNFPQLHDVYWHPQ